MIRNPSARVLSSTTSLSQDEHAQKHTELSARSRQQRLRRVLKKLYLLQERNMRVNTSHNGPCELSVNKSGKCFLVIQDDARNWVELRGVGRRVDLGCVRPCSSWPLRRLRSSLHFWIQIESRLQPYTPRNLSHLHALHMRMGVSLLLDVPLALLHGTCSHERY